MEGKVFLDAACVSLAPRRATEAIGEFLRRAEECPEKSATLNHIAMDAMRAATRRELAGLISAGEDEIALVESTTQGLTIAAEALPLARGDRVLVPDLEFLQVALPWLQKQKSVGIEVDPVPNRGGEVRIEDIAERIGARTRVLAISSVQWSNGYRVDLGALGALCRERRVWLVVDAIQQLGAMPIDVAATPMDFLACGGHKWLNAPFGCGFLYVKREVQAALRRPLAGYLSLETPAGGWGKYFETPTISPLGEFRAVEEAKAFEVGGTGNYPGAAGLGASVGMIREVGPRRIWEYIVGLTDRLIEGLDRIGVEVVTPRARENRSEIVTFSVGTAEENVAIAERLAEAGV
ncbi:MAG TPA: aminotransferase class V-fold PLP-dependent enzyme, partial [Candidatus Acidoferrales bacterium]|nr:aminotransferase class V-fold PLP-dependent enzyme [Candidatus Acidoferrales bacterium]